MASLLHQQQNKAEFAAKLLAKSQIYIIILGLTHLFERLKSRLACFYFPGSLNIPPQSHWLSWRAQCMMVIVVLGLSDTSALNKFTCFSFVENWPNEWNSRACIDSKEANLLLIVLGILFTYFRHWNVCNCVTMATESNSHVWRGRSSHSAPVKLDSLCDYLDNWAAPWAVGIIVVLAAPAEYFNKHGFTSKKSKLNSNVIARVAS